MDEVNIKMPEKKKSRKKRTKGQIIAIVIFVVFFLASLSAVLYPVVADYVAGLEKSGIQTSYEEKLENTDTSDIDALWASANAYNRKLAESITFSDEEADELSLEYHDLLNVMGNGLMCYVDIPIIDVYLPVYHGDDPSALELGVEHLYGSSLPVGGESTHAVLSAHTGLSSEKMFTDLEALEVGDIFYIHVLNETLAYQVDQIEVVLPQDVSKIKIEKGEDYATLITCTPYAVNTHRLLVRGTRIPYEEAVVVEQEIEETKTVESSWNQQYMKGILAGVALLIALLLVYFTVKLIVKKARKCRKEKDKRNG